ncbi:MAG: 50S ribosomal protein L15 [Candidatus Nomurabacteria bacterium]|jgi:large subunit ribosomal protein L15|nr:50S ribosomal protein L15 [Candidatus Nomurabacteria bacterium]
MTKYHELSASAYKNKKRVGRGIAAGGGKTAGRGTKGQKSRTGKKIRATFMGGQGPLVQRVPKMRGFKSLRVPAQVVYAQELTGAKQDNFGLYEAGLITMPYHAVKVINGKGDITFKGTLSVAGASKSVVEAIAKNGGKFVKTDVPLLPAKETKETPEAKKSPAKATKTTAKGAEK